jgi:tetratricopeptide (TPR) repeat protein
VAGQDIGLEVGAAWARETGGNPFFLLELARHLHEEGKLYRAADGRWTTSAPLRDLALPVAARDVALKRLSRLSEQANRLLGVAAAFEGAFRFDVVADLAGLSEDEGLDGLEETVAARILEPSGDSESYAFTHAVIRHALYDGLVPSRRSRLHRRVAEALSGGSAPVGASAAEIAVHYHRSLALPGAERGVEPAVEAADHAQATGAYDEAAAYLRLALDMLPSGDVRRPRLLGRLGIVLAWALAFDDAVPVAQEAGDAIAEAETKQAAAEYLADAAYACGSAGGAIPSWDLARHGLTYAGARDVAWARLVSFDYQRREAEDPEHPGIPLDTDERRQAAAVLRAAHLDPIGPAPMEAVFDTRDDAAAAANLLIRTMWAGEPAQALPGIEAEAVEAESLGRLMRASRGWASVSYAQIMLGRLDEARQSFERGRGLAARLGTPVGTLIYPQYLLCATLDEGWEQLAATFGFLEGSGDPALAWTLGFAHVGSAQAKAHLGDVDDALAALDRLIPWVERAPAWVPGYANMACGAAEVLWFLERTDHLEVIEQALRDKLLPADFRMGLADSRHGLACCCALAGRDDEAERWFAEARRVLTEQGAAAHLAICDFDEALMHVRRGGPDDAAAAEPLLQAALRQFEALGMTGWLRRARQREGLTV